jgi:hypothetical protein
LLTELVPVIAGCHAASNSSDAVSAHPTSRASPINVLVIDIDLPMIESV